MAPARDEEVITARQMVTPDSEVMAVSLDGVIINVRGDGRKEARVATIPAVEMTVAQEDSSRFQVPSGRELILPNSDSCRCWSFATNMCRSSTHAR